jgi:uncharacterized protein (TIGR02757 family)
VIKRTTQIKNILERLYARYNQRQFIPPDPLQFVYKYSSREDMEIAAFLSAILAYGRVQHIERSLTNLFARMGNSPFKFVKNFDAKKRARLKGFKHRFTSGDCLSDLFWLLKKILNQYGSIENFFLLGYRKTDRSIIPALSNFCDSFLNIYAESHNGQTKRGLKYLLASPTAGSACKRLNLFLRWMVRDDDVDTGFWKSVDKAKLIVPVDVHMGRLCRILKFHSHKTVSLSTALKITDSFSQIERADPVKYDFALSRIGIVEDCTGNLGPKCRSCELFGLCCDSQFDDRTLSGYVRN